MIEDVPCPEEIVAPGGTVQLYKDAFEIGEIEYARLVAFRQTLVEPEIDPDNNGDSDETTIVFEIVLLPSGPETLNETLYVPAVAN
jgi:hypothetical protein